MTTSSSRPSIGTAAPASAPLLELLSDEDEPAFDGSQLCAQVDPELFFPQKGGTTRPAKSLCSSCDMLVPCRRWALTARVGGYPIDGVWGGTSQRDRERIRRSVAALEVVAELDVAAVDQLLADVAVVDQDVA
jgi:WhiB family redox-sensing transcriptional regulator